MIYTNGSGTFFSSTKQCSFNSGLIQFQIFLIGFPHWRGSKWIHFCSVSNKTCSRRKTIYADITAWKTLREFSVHWCFFLHAHWVRKCFRSAKRHSHPPATFLLSVKFYLMRSLKMIDWMMSNFLHARYLSGIFSSFTLQQKCSGRGLSNRMKGIVCLCFFVCIFYYENWLSIEFKWSDHNIE